jgi:hypothetical protein
MNAPALSPRILAALGVARCDTSTDPGQPTASVDNTDRRFRDAIKAGALPVSPPISVGAHRTARLTDPTTGTTITIRSTLPVLG